jgi:hypothetical protein
MTVSVNGTTGITFNDASTQNTAATGFGFKNRIINGAMVIDQRNAGDSVTFGTASEYFVDRWTGNNGGGATITAQQSSTAPSGFVNSLLVNTSSGGSPSSGQLRVLRQKIEGFNVADLGWGTANAQTITVSFWIRSNVTGTFACYVANSAYNRSQVNTFVISVANTWEQKSVTFLGDTSGTWGTTTGTGIEFGIDVGSGSDFNATAGVWNSAFDTRTSGAVTLSSTTSNNLYLTGVQLEKGSTATSFDYRPYGTELQLCQRYCEVLKNSGVTNFAQIAVGQCEASTSGTVGYFYQTAKRAAPTVTYDTANKYSVTGSGGSAITLSSISTARADTTSLAIGFGVASGLTGGNATRLLDNNTNNPITIISSEL